jgi:argininosuccinate lyase
MFKRDMSRVNDTYKRLDVMPLGSGALAGTSYPIDRTALAKELGFAGVSANSMDAVSDRDFAAEIIFDLSMVMTHLSRFCSELILWSSSEFKFIEIGDAFTTGSSIMPQKKNPDVAELIRGKTGSLYGDLVAILSLMKGMVLTYNRDFQEDKTHIFSSIDTAKASVKVFTKMLAGIKVNSLAMRKVLDANIVATDLADYLVKKGVAFRAAHEATGKIVSFCEKSGKDMRVLSLSEFRKFNDKIENDIYDAIRLENSVEMKDVYGGTARSRVLAAIAKAKKET